MTLEEHIKQSMISCPLTDEQEGLLIKGIENYLDELDRVKNCSIPVVVGQSEEFICYEQDWEDKPRCISQCRECGEYECRSN
jgi:hypothetical protein